MLADRKDGLAVAQMQCVTPRAAALRDDHARGGLGLNLGRDGERLAGDLRRLRRDGRVSPIAS